MLIDEIIQLLSTDQGSITEALLKTKILLHQIGHRELVDWVNKELNGYADGADVPAYRIAHAHVVGTLVNIRMRATGHPIPLGHLTDAQRQSLEISSVRESLAVVAQFAESNSLHKPLPMEYNNLLGHGLAEHTHVEQAWCEFSPVEMKNIIFQVRTRLLDFMLDLKSSIGSAVSEEDVKANAVNVDATSLFNKAIFGSHTTIIVGDHNKQIVGSTVVKGDFASLADKLQNLGVGREDIDELQKAIGKDSGKEPTPTVRGKVTHWLKTLAEKQLDIGAQAALTFSIDAVVHAVKAYMGG